MGTKSRSTETAPHTRGLPINKPLKAAAALLLFCTFTLWFFTRFFFVIEVMCFKKEILIYHELKVFFYGAELLLFLSGAGYLVYSAGRKNKSDNIKNFRVDMLPTEVIIICMAAVAFLAKKTNYDFLTDSMAKSVIEVFATLYIVTGLAAAFEIAAVLCISRQYKSKLLVKRSVVARFIHMTIKYKNNYVTFLIISIPVMAAFLGLFMFISGGLAYNQNTILPLIITVILYLAASVLLMWHFASINSVTEEIRCLAENRDFNADGMVKRTYMAKEMSAELVKLKASLKTATDEAVRGERLKTELITNVSHDLKTPLTSIINYVGLIKREGAWTDDTAKYLDVLDNKSQRLKKLTDDLIEASKAASGCVKVNKTPIDLSALMRQSTAEFEEKAAAAGVSFAADYPKAPVTAFCDGSLMWRVISNLLSNAVKYSAKGSRIYIKAENTGGVGLIEIKNVSAAPLNVPPERLFERFARGDSSRTAEGSGLGLSIAKSLTELMDGKIGLAIDGDLFKVRVSFPA